MRKLWIFITLLYGLLLAFISLKDSHYLERPPAAEIIFHNLCHIPAYFILTILLIVSFQAITRRHLGIICTAAFLYGVLLEIGQSFVPHRYFSVMDMGLNAVGVGAGIYLWVVLKNKNMIDVNMKVGK